MRLLSRLTFKKPPEGGLITADPESDASEVESR